MASGTNWKLDLAIALIVLVLGAIGLYLYTQSSPSHTEPTSSSGRTQAAAGGATAAAPAPSESGTAARPSSSKTRAASLATATDAPSPANTFSRGDSTFAEASSSAGSLSSMTASVAEGTAAAGAPPSHPGITLAGTFAATDQYTIATGTFANVPGPSSTVALDGLTTPADPAQETRGAIYVGDATWYAAGEGGFGSCGQKLYDGQQPYFAAMSLYHWMGSPGPSPHCWACVSLQSVADPDKAVTAIVADSCEACEFAHVDLEQAAYYALGGTVDSGVVTVAWTFVDCPSGYSEKAVAALDAKVYKAVDLS